MGERGKCVMGNEKGTCWDEHRVLYGNQFDNQLCLKKEYCEYVRWSHSRLQEGGGQMPRD